jgi:hypothetical protein
VPLRRVRARCPLGYSRLMRLVALTAVLATAACAAPGFVGHTGRVTPKGEFRVTLGSGYQVNTSAADVVKDGRDVARTLRSRATTCPGGTGSCWTVEDVKPVVDAAFRFALVAPFSTHTEISGRYGFAPGVDGGIHWGPDSRALDLGWQVFGPRDGSAGWAGTALVSYGTRSLGTLGDVIEDVFRGEASLTDYQVTFVAGRQWRELAHAYVGARYLMTRWDIEIAPALPIDYGAGRVEAAVLGTDPAGEVHQVGAVVGGALGWRRVFVGAELNLLQTFGSARVLFEERSLSGFGVMPAVYVYGQY